MPTRAPARRRPAPPRNRPGLRRTRQRRRLVSVALVAFLLGGAYALERWQAGLGPSVQMGVPVDWQNVREAWTWLRELDLREPLRTDALRLLAVEMRGLRRLSADAMVGRLRLPAGIHLVDVDPEAVCARLREHGRISACAAVRVPPGRLLVAVEERVAVATLLDTGEGVDSSGARFELEPDESAALPSAEGDLDRAVTVIEAARAEGLALAHVSARDPHGVSVWAVGSRVRVRVGDAPRESFAAYRSLTDAAIARASGVVDLSRIELDLRFRGRMFLRAAQVGASADAGTSGSRADVGRGRRGG